MKYFHVLTVYLCAGAAAADQWSWDFDGDLSARGGVGGSLEAFGSYSFENAVMNGELARVLRFEAGSGPATDARFAVYNPVGANGFAAASFTNQFTVILDVRFPVSDWVSLVQTNATNTNDGDWFIRSDGGMGINGDYTDSGNQVRFGFDQWRRIVWVIDQTSPSGSDATMYRSYVDGELQNIVQEPGSWGMDSRFTLEPIFHLFADESGETPDWGQVNCVQIRDYPMSDAEIAALGRSSAGGIPGDPPDPGVHDFYVGPFLQWATPTSVWIVWESLTGEESRVDYGLTPDLGSTAYGDSIGSTGSARIHRTQLTGLTPDAVYHYAVTTQEWMSEVFRLRTPPLPTDEQAFRFAAVSDTQSDGANPNKLFEVINEGIIDYVTAHFGPNLEDELGFILDAGDIVSSGPDYAQWKNDFFDECEPLLHHISLYPVYGNHEGDTHWFQDYFVLPENGTPGYEDHWYYIDYGNVRIIGMDSNTGYTNQEQLDWLDGVLADAAGDADIDFAFAQLHHPHKSELWTPGEIPFTGEVVRRLERFTQDTGKPSVHFFGHTHGYSRGQSRDHQHLWVNIAAGEGNPDYWGEYPQADYDEFQYSTPDWGFVLVEVEAGDHPRFELRRISRGNEYISRDNEVLDRITIRMDNSPPAQPTGVYPTVADSPVSPDGLALRASDFSDPDADAHWESHFQVTGSPGDYSDPVIDEWVRFENWYSPPDAAGPSTGYYSVNTVTDPDITRMTRVSLEPDRAYYWRVRYRDEGLRWSEWSQETMFTTGESVFGPNRLANPGAEHGVVGWLVLDPPLESLREGDCSTTFSGVGGERFFAVGGVCADEGPYGEAYQAVDVSDDADPIDAGRGMVRYAGYMRDWSGSDRPELWVEFKDGAGRTIAVTDKLAGAIPQWTYRDGIERIPRGSRTLEFHISGTLVAGFDNDCYLDDLALEMGISPPDCPPDFNGDGDLNSQDFVAFLNAFVTGDPDADFNGDGSLNSLDFVDFLNAFVTGC